MANSYLARTPSSAGNKQIFTISMWLKRGSTGVLQKPFSAGASNGAFTAFEFPTDDKPRFVYYNGSSVTIDITADQRLRDVNGWYHIVWAVDTTQATANNRVKLYINGTQVTDLATNTQPAQNWNFDINNTVVHNIGRGVYNSSEYFDGYISHFALVDGQQLTPTTFGQTDSTSGIWKFNSPSGVTWGTNGVHLKFENSGALGTDSSGQSNTYTVNGNLKQAVDTPSNVHATWNAIDNYYSNFDIQYGNLEVLTPSTSDTSAPIRSTLGVDSGKWYWEVKCVNVNTGTWTYGTIGITSRDIKTNAQGNHLGSYTEDWVYYSYNGHILNADGGNTGDTYGNSYTAGDIVGVALDLDNNKLYFSKNGTWQNSGDPTSGSTGTGAVAINAPTVGTNAIGLYFPAVGDYHYAPRYRFAANFGNGFFGTTAIASAGSNGNGSLFEYDVPSGYYALNTKNINTYG